MERLGGEVKRELSRHGGAGLMTELVAAWPDGNEASCGMATSVFGSAYRNGGRGRSTRAFSPIDDQSARATAITVRAKTPQRR